MPEERRFAEFAWTYVGIHGLGFVAAQLYQSQQVGGWGTFGSMLFLYPLYALLVGMVGCGVLAAKVEQWQVRYPLLAILGAIFLSLFLPIINVLVVKLMTPHSG